MNREQGGTNFRRVDSFFNRRERKDRRGAQKGRAGKKMGAKRYGVLNRE
jgi:hypothetical protein